MPTRIQLRRTKGWRKPPGTIVVSRPTAWGNPFRSAASYRRWLATGIICIPDLLSWADEHTGKWLDVRRAWILRHLGELRGHDLGCWCPIGNAECHGDVLLELANAEVQS